MRVCANVSLTWDQSRDDLDVNNPNEPLTIGQFNVYGSEPLQYKGTRAVEFLATRDTVIIQNTPNFPLLRVLKNRNPHLKIIAWLNLVEQTSHRPWSLTERKIWDAVEDYWYMSTRNNGHGNRFVDAYEGPPSAPGHWGDINFRHAAYTQMDNQQMIDAWLDGFACVLEEFRGFVAGALIDNMMPRPNFGSATNAPNPLDLEQTFQAGMRYFVDEFRRRFPQMELWGNTDLLNIYGVDVPWDELAFHSKTVDEIIARVAELKRCSLNPQAHSVLAGQIAKEGPYGHTLQRIIRAAGPEFEWMHARSGNWKM